MNDVPLAELMRVVEKALPYTSKNYPGLPAISGTDDAALADALHHAQLHQTKALGVFATMLEPRDHGEETPLNRALIERTLVKQLGNALRVLVALGLTPEQVRSVLLAEFKPR